MTQAPFRATRRATVLVVDPSVFLRDIYGTLLRYHGHRALEAADGAAAVALARGERPDAIVMEAEMPGMGGLEAARLLRSDPATAEIPVILVASGPGTRHLREARQAGVRAFLEKPFEPRALLSQVERVLASAAGALQTA